MASAHESHEESAGYTGKGSFAKTVLRVSSFYVDRGMDHGQARRGVRTER